MDCKFGLYFTDHSLLFVTTHPLVILVGMAILSRFKEMKPASRMEWIGGIIGVTGAIIILQDGGTIQGDHEVTVFGDLLPLQAVF